MDSLTTIIIELATIITAIGVIGLAGGKWLKKQLDPIVSSISKMDLNSSKCYLVNFLTDIENGVHKDEVQITLVHEMYDHYVKDLNGNSYIHDKWEKLKTKFE